MAKSCLDLSVDLLKTSSASLELLLARKVTTSDGQGRGREGGRERGRFTVDLFSACFALRTWQRPFFLVLALNITEERSLVTRWTTSIFVFNKRDLM